MEEGPKATTEHDGRDEEDCEEPRESIAAVGLPTPDDQINDARNETEATDTAANHLERCNFALLQMLPVDRDVF